MPQTKPYITPQQVYAIAYQDGLQDEQLKLSGMAILTFSKAVMDRLDERCALEETQWISQRHHPYSAAQLVKRGQYQGLSVTALIPPMGTSPLACVVEDLVACGIQAVFLVCAAWSLGPPVAFGDLIVPAYSIGRDGTSIHYGNRLEHVSANPQVVEALQKNSNKPGPKIHVGGNASCEALYRITPQMVADFRSQSCLCMDNGEAGTLFAVTRTLGVPGGVLFQPYIDLQEGWNPSRLDKSYTAICQIQAEIALEAGLQLKQNKLLGKRRE
ncbi:MAG: hypothetical protein JW963_17990 [Anaerolineales bacterium]|nr:hypothetical protein [Anaerolineales bacterium]